MASVGSKRVYEFICEKINTGEWKPGDRIWTEETLAKNLEVSRVAVRDAVGQLVAQMRLKRKQGSGTYVMEDAPITIIAAPANTMTAKDVLDLNRFRLGFETENVRNFIKFGTEKQIEKLEQTVDAMENNSDNVQMFCENDYRFHRIIAEGSDNQFVMKIFDFMEPTFMEHHLKLNSYVGCGIGIEYHRKILNAIKDRDEALGTLLMRRHIEAVVKNMEEHTELI